MAALTQLLLLCACALLAVPPPAAAVVKIQTDRVTHGREEDNAGAGVAMAFVRADGSAEDDPSDVHFPGHVSVDGNLTVGGTSVRELQRTVDYLLERVNEIESTPAVTCDPGFQEGPSGCIHFKTCRLMHIAQPDTPSGVYTIDPDGEAGPLAPVAVYCDMDTNSADDCSGLEHCGAGLTHVMTIKSDTSAIWKMYDYPDGLNVDNLAGTGARYVADGPTALLSAAHIRAIFMAEGSNREYWCHMGKSLMRIDMQDEANYDSYLGIYKSAYSKTFVDKIWRIKPNNALGRSFQDMNTGALSGGAAEADDWAATSNQPVGRGDCPGNGCHYLPDDTPSPGETHASNPDDHYQWLHRQQASDPGGAGAGSKCNDRNADCLHVSKLFLR